MPQKQKLCKNWQATGRCQYGQGCHFLHTTAQGQGFGGRQPQGHNFQNHQPRGGGHAPRGGSNARAARTRATSGAAPASRFLSETPRVAKYL